MSRTCPDGRNRKIFEFFSENRGLFSICLAVTPIESSCAKAEKSRFFFGKIRFFTERLPKNFEYKAWKCSSRGTRDPELFFVFFWEKGGFLLSVCQKNLNKGGDGFPRGLQGPRTCGAPVGTGDFRKFMKFFLKTGAKTYPCLAITPIEGHLVAGFGWIRLFSKKAEKTLIVF